MDSQSDSAVYLPLELCKRELMSNAFLATRLALDGVRVYVFEHTYFDEVGWPYKGIYIGKNCFRSFVSTDTTFYSKMKNMGIALWYLDPEGGFYTGVDEESFKKGLAQRLDPSLLDEHDNILSWGEWQYDYYSEKEVLPKIYITGHPNFELYQPKYSSAFQSWDAINTQGLENFVLINSSFGSSFASMDSSSLLGNLAQHRPKDEYIQLVDGYLKTNIEFLSMLSLIREVAQALRDTSFVVRPHPSEDPSFYNTYLNDLSNVSVITTGDVGSWIRRSKLVIHSKCTTGVQTEIAQKPVISLQLSTTGGSTKEYGHILNKVGYQLSKAEEIIEFIENPVIAQQERKPWARTISNLNSIDTIVDLYRSSLGRIERGKIKNTYSFSKYLVKESKAFIKNKILKRETPGQRKFDYQLFNQFPKMIAIAGEYYGNQVNIKRISHYCYEILL